MPAQTSPQVSLRLATPAAFLPCPPVRVARFDLSHHAVEGVIQVDSLAVGHANENEKDVGHLHGEVGIRLVLLFRFLAEAMIHLASEFSDLLGESGEVREGMEVAFLELGDPAIDPLLVVGKRHGER